MKNKLIKCKICGADIARNAKTCPFCGAKNRNMRPIAGISGILLGLLFLWYMPFAERIDPKTPSAGTADSAIIKVTATDLYFSYSNNYVAADESYKDRTISVTGAVYSIDKFLERPCIALLGDEHISEAVICLFDDDESLPLIAELSEGDTVTIQGRCDGIQYSNAPVWVKGCQIISG